MSRPRVLKYPVSLPAPLGWIALVGTGKTLLQLTFGHASARAALKALEANLAQDAQEGPCSRRLVRRLEAYAAGEPVDFSDIEIDPGPASEFRVSPFRRRVILHCRRIRYGQTLSYGQLAAQAGSPGAARAVGSCMAVNRIPLIVPCHRVLPANGHPGAFSAPGGSRTKERLLAMEAAGRKN